MDERTHTAATEAAELRALRRAQFEQLGPLARRAVERLAAALHQDAPEGVAYPNSWRLGNTQFAARSVLWHLGVDGDDQDAEKDVAVGDTPSGDPTVSAAPRTWSTSQLGEGQPDDAHANPTAALTAADIQTIRGQVHAVLESYNLDRHDMVNVDTRVIVQGNEYAGLRIDATVYTRPTGQPAASSTTAPYPDGWDEDATEDTYLYGDPDEEAAEATVPGTWPDREPATVRSAEKGTQTVSTPRADRPSWLPDGCPSWCEEAGRHAEGDHFDDRIHCGPAVEMVLTAAGQDVDDIGDGPNTARLYLLQHYRETGPRIELCRDDRPTGILLTPGEGTEFAEELLRLVEVARIAVDTGDEDGPVAERSTGPLCATVWASPGRVDVFRDERRPDWERPLTPGEATEFAGKLLDLAAIADGAQR